MTVPILEKLGEMEREVREAEFRYRCAAVLRASHLRKMRELEKSPLMERTVEIAKAVRHHKSEARAQELVMQEAVRTAQQVEAEADHLTETDV